MIPKGRPSFVSETASVRSAVSSSSKSAKSGRSSFLSKAPKSPSTAATSVEAEPDEAQTLKRLSKLSLATGEGPTDTGWHWHRRDGEGGVRHGNSIPPSSLVVGKSGSELQFKPEPLRTGPEVRFKVQKIC